VMYFCSHAKTMTQTLLCGELIILMEALLWMMQMGRHSALTQSIHAAAWRAINQGSPRTRTHPLPRHECRAGDAIREALSRKQKGPSNEEATKRKACHRRKPRPPSVGGDERVEQQRVERQKGRPGKKGSPEDASTRGFGPVLPYYRQAENPQNEAPSEEQRGQETRNPGRGEKEHAEYGYPQASAEVLPEGGATTREQLAQIAKKH
jgi:hypothetical protein